MVAYPFPPRVWVPGASIRLVKFLKYITRLRPAWEIDVVVAGYGPDEETQPIRAADLLDEVPDSVGVIRLADPAYEQSTEPNAGARLGHLARRAVAKAVKPISRSLAARIRPAHPVAAELLPDAQVSWNAAVLTWLDSHPDAQSYNVIYASSPPYSTAVLGAKLKQRLGVPLVVDIKDNWLTGRRNHPTERRRVEDELEREVIETADRVLCVTAGGLEHYQEHYAEHRERFELITNGVDLADYADIDPSQPRKRKFKLTYAGSLGGENRSPVRLFEAFARLLAEPGIRADECLACFPEHMNPAFWAAVDRLGLKGRVLGSRILPMQEFKHHLADSEALVSINYRGETTLVPGKLYEYWAAGRPIFLIETPGAATELVHRYGLGRAADPDDGEGIYRALRAFYDDWAAGGAPAPPRDGLEQFSREALAARLCDVFEQVAGRCAPARMEYA
jgi:glycosyltransferase involved in cell wall biosynthesis